MPATAEPATPEPAVEPAREGLHSQSLVELAVARLRTDILSGAFVPGQRLPEEALTRRFQISRAPLREALRLLAEQGLVEHLPRRGARVTTYSDRDFDELFAVRDALEHFAVGLVTRRPQDELDFSGLLAAFDALDTAAATENRLAASQAHRAFHLAVVALADSRQLLLTYEPVIVKLRLYMAANLRREADSISPAEGVRRHKRLLDAIMSGAPERVDVELARHGSRRYFH